MSDAEGEPDDGVRQLREADSTLLFDRKTLRELVAAVRTGEISVEQSRRAAQARRLIDLLAARGYFDRPDDQLRAQIGTAVEADTAGPAEPIVIGFRSASEALVRALVREPKLLHELHWRRFEELVAHLLEGQGFEVELTPPSGDRGVDIYARRQGALGRTLYVVECKKHRVDRPVGPDLVRALYGVVERERASGGILATTSVFTTGARAEADGELAYRMTLRDGDDILGWAEQQRDGGDFVP